MLTKVKERVSKRSGNITVLLAVVVSLPASHACAVSGTDFQKQQVSTEESLPLEPSYEAELLD